MLIKISNLNRISSLINKEYEYQSLSSFKTNKIRLLPMYLENIIGPDDVYDYAHTNSFGSQKIGSYIYKSGVIDY